MSKQTAVEWLIDNLPQRFKNAMLLSSKEIIEQAKAMEREQAREHYIAGFSERDGINAKLFWNPLANEYNEKRFEEYYTKFKGGEQ